MPTWADHEKALMRSQSGPFAGVALPVAPINFLTRIDPSLFRVCRCGRPLDPCGHHRAACSRAGLLGRRGFAVESAAARVCREAGGRVAVNVMVRDMDLALPNAHDTRRLEVFVDGLPLYGGAQLAIDMSPIRGDGTARPGTANIDGIILAQARRRKERTHPDLVDPCSRARLVVLAGEVGGRWSEETQTFLHILARAKARSEPPILRKRVEQAWRMRWAATLACSAARAFATSILDLRVGGGADGDVPRSHDVANDFRHVCLG